MIALYRFSRVAVAVLLAVAVSSSAVLAQSELEKALKQLNSDVVKGYIQPVADLFGANMNAGLYRSARIPSTGFIFAFDLVAMGSLVSDDQKTYMVKPPVDLPSFKTATIFGGKGDSVTGPLGFKFKGSDGIINASIFPLVAPQVTIGSLYGTVATIRFLTTPTLASDKFPKTTLWGLGLRHSISQYIEESPVEISAGFFYSSFTVGDLLNFKGLSIGAQASKNFSLLNIYGGLAWEKSSLGLSYQFRDPLSANNAPVGIDITLDGANKFRATAGVALDLYVLHLFADANFGSITNFSGGIGFGF